MDPELFSEFMYSDENESNEHALNLNFTLGYSANMTGAVHNLTLKSETESFTEIFFPSAQTGVIYNYETGEQKLLQGHVKFYNFNIFIFFKLVQSNNSNLYRLRPCRRKSLGCNCR
jgi:hypothetical protein